MDLNFTRLKAYQTMTKYNHFICKFYSFFVSPSEFSAFSSFAGLFLLNISLNCSFDLSKSSFLFWILSSKLFIFPSILTVFAGITSLFKKIKTINKPQITWKVYSHSTLLSHPNTLFDTPGSIIYLSNQVLII